MFSTVLMYPLCNLLALFKIFPVDAISTGTPTIYCFEKTWRNYFFTPINKDHIFICSPLLLVLCIIFIGTKGLNFQSFSDLLLMFIMQMFVVAFIEETVFRGIMLRILLAKGTFTAVWISSILLL